MLSEDNSRGLPRDESRFVMLRDGQLCGAELTQNLLPVREWGFKSLHPHQSGLPPTKIGRLAPTVDGLRKARAQDGDERSEIVGRNNGQEILRGEATSRCGDDRHVCSQGCQQISRPLFRDGRLHD